VVGLSIWSFRYSSGDDITWVKIRVVRIEHSGHLYSFVPLKLTCHVLQTLCKGIIARCGRMAIVCSYTSSNISSKISSQSLFMDIAGYGGGRF
jgi:hypothetical protein